MLIFVSMSLWMRMKMVLIFLVLHIIGSVKSEFCLSNDTTKDGCIYYGYTSPLSQTEAHNYCQRFGGELYLPDSVAMTLSLGEFMEDYSVQESWLPMRETQVTWEDATGLSDSALRQLLGESPNDVSYDACLAFSGDVQSGRPTLTQLECSEERGFLCESSDISQEDCKGFFLTSSNRCYTPYSKSKPNWFRAGRACTDLGDELTRINSLKEAEEIATQILLKGVTVDLWIDHTSRPWKKPTAASRPSFYGWALGQPDSLGHQCAVIRSSDYVWYDVDCDVSRPYFCHYGPAGPLETTSIKTTTIDDEGSNSPSTDDNQAVLIGAGAGGGAMVLIIILVIIGVCVCKANRTSGKGADYTNTMKSDGNPTLFHGRRVMGLHNPYYRATKMSESQNKLNDSSSDLTGPEFIGATQYNVDTFVQGNASNNDRYWTWREGNP